MRTHEKERGREKMKERFKNLPFFFPLRLAVLMQAYFTASKQDLYSTGLAQTRSLFFWNHNMKKKREGRINHQSLH